MFKYLLALSVLAAVSLPLTASAEDCFLCGSGSTNGCNQCRGGDRKACEARGCKISGTASCSTAANVKVCQSGREPRTSSAVSSVALR